jgi:hypothetical protein
MDVRIEIRCSTIEKNRIKALAAIYADGNLSLWLVHSAMNAPRKKINGDNIKESARNKKPPRN